MAMIYRAFRYTDRGMVRTCIVTIIDFELCPGSICCFVERISTKIYGPKDDHV